jgi:hypothetical protein
MTTSFQDFLAQPHPQVEGDLIVARAAGVELGAGGNAPGQLGLDIHVNVLQFGPPAKAAGVDVVRDAEETAGDGASFGATEHADAMEHCCVGEGPLDVMPPQAPIKRNGFGERRHVGSRPAGKAPTAGDNGGFLHRFQPRDCGARPPFCHARSGRRRNPAMALGAGAPDSDPTRFSPPRAASECGAP